MTAPRKHTVFPGQFFITTVPMLITTVLGSCVSVCLWDKRTKVAAINHYLLPGTSDDLSGDATRGYLSIHLLVRSLRNRQVQLEDIEAKVFGGSHSLHSTSDIYKVGERNASMAFEILKQYGISVVAHHVGGIVGRKIVFNTSNGKVRMRLLNEVNTGSK
ncbi:MAG TPA: chemotaxis protein CheD [Chryseolinea sp.]|nr:chemotaxis protein CheD [Chryseolinea sp.]